MNRRDFVIGILVIRKNQRKFTINKTSWLNDSPSYICTKFTFLITPHKAQWHHNSTNTERFVYFSLYFCFIMSIDLGACMWNCELILSFPYSFKQCLWFGNNFVFSDEEWMNRARYLVNHEIFIKSIFNCLTSWSSSICLYDIHCILYIIAFAF